MLAAHICGARQAGRSSPRRRGMCSDPIACSAGCCRRRQTDRTQASAFISTGPTSTHLPPPRRHADCGDCAPRRHGPVLRVLLVLCGLHLWWVLARMGSGCSIVCCPPLTGEHSLPHHPCCPRLLTCPAPASPAPRCADTTLGLLLTIALHKAALRGAAWYGRRAAERVASEELQPAVAPSGDADGSGNSPGSSALGDRWFEVLQACGNYGAWAAAAWQAGVHSAACCSSHACFLTRLSFLSSALLCRGCDASPPGGVGGLHAADTQWNSLLSCMRPALLPAPGHPPGRAVACMQ